MSYCNSSDMYRMRVKYFTAVLDSFGKPTYVYKGTIQCSISVNSDMILDKEGRQFIPNLKMHYKGQTLSGMEYILYDGTYYQMKQHARRIDRVSNKVLGGIAYL